jgi:hypothetical protein
MRQIVPHLGCLKRINWRWWSFSFRGMYERAKEAILIIPVVYKIYRFDYSSLLILMEYWMGRMQKCHEKDTWHCPKDVKHKVVQIKRCRFLLKRLIVDSYDEPFRVEHDKRWGEAQHWSSPFELGGEKYYTWNTSRPNVVFKDDKVQERKEYKRWLLEHPVYLEKQDREYLFKLMSKYIRGWWN